MAASKFFSFVGLAPISINAWEDHKKKIEGEAKLFFEEELNRASRGVKGWKFPNGELNCSLAAKVCSCYMLPVKVLLLEKIDPYLISIRINI